MEEHHKAYESGKINQYELADLLGLEYAELGTYVLRNGLKQIDKEALYAITCPYCNAKWIIPFLERYNCGDCNNIVEVEY